MSMPDPTADHSGEARVPARTTHLALVEEADAPAEVRALYAKFREHFGRPRVPGILKCFATHPPLLEHMIGLAESMLFSEGALGRSNKELLATFLSASNDCAYCADSHGASLLEQSGSADLLDAAMRCDAASAALAPAQQTLLHLVAKINGSAGRIDAADVAAVRAGGWTELQIAEAIHLSALFSCFNRVVSAFGLPSQQLLPSFEPSAAETGGAR